MRCLNKLFLPVLLVISLAVHNSLRAQNELMGVWRVSCPIEKIGDTGGILCDLCPTEFDKKTKTETVLEFEMKFEAKAIIFSTPTSITTTFYTWDDSKRVLQFKFNKRKYEFRAYVSHGSRVLVLKEVEGTLVILERKSS